jgi:hypothetical protein
MIVARLRVASDDGAERQPKVTGTTIDPQRMATYCNSVSRKKISTTVYITPEQDAQLKSLHGRTRVPVAEYIREGIDLVLARYRDELPGQAELFRSRERPSRSG